MQRPDSRGVEEFRPLCLQQGVLGHAQGSAYVEFGNTKAIVGVFGPHESDKKDQFSLDGRINVDVSVMRYPSQQKRGSRNKTKEEIDLDSSVQEAIRGVVLTESFPKLVLDIHCTVLECDGSVASALIIGASLALANAGIDMKDLVASCTVSRSGDTLLLDPCGTEQKNENSGLLISMASSLGQVTQIACQGPWSSEALQKAIELGVGGCSQVLHSAMRQIALEGVQ